MEVLVLIINNCRMKYAKFLLASQKGLAKTGNHMLECDASHFSIC